MSQTEFNRMRFITYPGTDVVIVCFSVVRAASLDSVVSRWLPELDVYCPPTVPVVLVGTQTDLRPATSTGDVVHQRRRGPATAADVVATVGREHGARTARKIGAHSYVECSALSGVGLADVFVEAAKAALNAASPRRRRRRSSSCTGSSRTQFFDVASSLVCWRTTAVIWTLRSLAVQDRSVVQRLSHLLLHFCIYSLHVSCYSSYRVQTLETKLVQRETGTYLNAAAYAATSVDILVRRGYAYRRINLLTRVYCDQRSVVCQFSIRKPWWVRLHFRRLVPTLWPRR